MRWRKPLILTGFSILALVLCFLLPQNREWLQDKVIAYGNDFLHQRNKLDLEYRKTRRWQNDYRYAKQIRQQWENSRDTSALILLPSTNYFKSRGLDFHVPEPAVFYYYTGLKTVWSNSKAASGASYIVVVENKAPRLLPVKNAKMLADSISAYQKFPPEL